MTDTTDNGWIGVDLDGTLAEYHGWKGEDHIGKPIPAMLERVKRWLAEGRDVRIFTARVWEGQQDRRRACVAIERWCLTHIGQTLPVTCVKDWFMTELWDDRAVQVETNTARTVESGGTWPPDVCWHCHDQLLVWQERPHCTRCPSDGCCDLEDCSEPGCNGELPIGYNIEPKIADVVRCAVKVIDKAVPSIELLADLGRAINRLEDYQLRACGINFEGGINDTESEKL